MYKYTHLIHAVDPCRETKRVFGRLYIDVSRHVIWASGRLQVDSVIQVIW